MSQATHHTMHAAAIDEFGGPLTMRTLPVPDIDPDELLLKVESAGVGVWDPFEMKGGFAEMMGITPHFPYVPGSEGAGEVAQVGAKVKDFKKGDRVYAASLANAKGGFYAEYVAVKAKQASWIPGKLTVEQAGAMPVDAVTALVGLDEKLGLKRGESLLIFGASGGIGHMALQLAKRMGARVLAVASGKDGVELATRLGADKTIDGHKDDALAAARAFAPDGLDCILLTAGGKHAEETLKALRKGGRVAHPNGVEPAPKARAGIKIESYDGEPGPRVIAKLNKLIEQGPFEVGIDKVYPLDKAVEALKAVGKHHLGKIILHPA